MRLDDYRDLSIWQALDRRAAEQGAREALVCGERRLSYGELRDQAAALSAALYAREVGAGDKVAAILPNGPEFVIAYFACARLGAVYVPLNTRYRQRELAFMLADCEARALIVIDSYADFAYAPLIDELRQGLPLLEHVITVGGPSGADSFAALLESGDAPPPARIAPAEDVFTILYTSGTTGTPKGAMGRHILKLHNARVWGPQAPKRPFPSGDLGACGPQEIFPPPIRGGYAAAYRWRSNREALTPSHSPHGSAAISI